MSSLFYNILIFIAYLALLSRDSGTRKDCAECYWGLAQAFIKPSSERLVGVYYFSAFATWLPGPHRRHQAFVRALKGHGVTVVLGHFKKKARRCPKCRHSWIGHEEKESDVNLVIHLLNAARSDLFDTALLLTSDTDMVPVINMVRGLSPPKQVVAIIPQRRFQHSLELRNACDNAIRIRESHLSTNLFPEEILDAEGRIVARRPIEYAPPPKGNGYA